MDGECFMVKMAFSWHFTPGKPCLTMEKTTWCWFLVLLNFVALSIWHDAMHQLRHCPNDDRRPPRQKVCDVGCTGELGRCGTLDFLGTTWNTAGDFCGTSKIFLWHSVNGAWIFNFLSHHKPRINEYLMYFWFSPILRQLVQHSQLDIALGSSWSWEARKAPDILSTLSTLEYSSETRKLWRVKLEHSWAEESHSKDFAVWIRFQSVSIHLDLTWSNPESNMVSIELFRDWGHGWIDGGCFQGWLRRRRPSTAMAQSMAQSSHQKMLRKRCECVAIRIVHVFSFRIWSYLIMKCWRTVLFTTHTHKKNTHRKYYLSKQREKQTNDIPMNYPWITNELPKQL